KARPAELYHGHFSIKTKHWSRATADYLRRSTRLLLGIFLTRSCGLFGRCGLGFFRPRGRGLSALFATFFGRGGIGLLAATRTAFFATSAHIVDRGPRASLGFFLFNAPLFITLDNVFGLALSFICVFVFIALWHDRSSSCK